MNCKQGDLAVIVRSAAGNEGKIVRCVRFIGYVPGFIGEDRWEIDLDLPTMLGGTCRHVMDGWMRPIRGGEGADETLSWAGKPEKVAA